MDEKVASAVWSRDVSFRCDLSSVQVCQAIIVIGYKYASNIYSLFTFLSKFRRYAVPLFFVCVRGNVGYIVVAVFIPENEDTTSLEEALEKIKLFNPGWNPRNLVDFSMAAIEKNPAKLV